jgi:hypothetical protein
MGHALRFLLLFMGLSPMIQQAQVISWVDHSSGITNEEDPQRGGGLSTRDGTGVLALYRFPEPSLRTFDWQGVVVEELAVPNIRSLLQVNDGHMITGLFLGSLNLFGTQLVGGTGGNNVFVARLNAEGALLWAVHSVCVPGQANLQRSAVAPNGRTVLLLGAGTAQVWGDDTIPALTAGRQLVVLDEEGALSWYKQLWSPVNSQSWYDHAEVTINDAGEVWLAGMLPHDLNVDDDTITSPTPNNYDHMIARFSPEGMMTGHLVVPGHVPGPGIVAKSLLAWPDGRAFWGGYYRNGTVLGDSTLQTEGLNQGLFMELASDMSIMQVLPLRSEQFTSFAAMAGDPANGKLVLSGVCGRQAAIAGDPLHVDAHSSAFVMVRNVNGGLDSWTPVLYANSSSGTMWPLNLVVRNGVVHVNGYRTGLVRRMDGLLLPLGNSFLIRLDDASAVSVVERVEDRTPAPACWPSPTRDLLHVAVEAQGAVEYRVYGADGRSVLRGNWPDRVGTATLHVEHLSTGTYFLHLASQHGSTVQRFAVER